MSDLRNVIVASKRFEDDLCTRLRDKEFAMAYLVAAKEDDRTCSCQDGREHAESEIAKSREATAVEDRLPLPCEY